MEAKDPLHCAKRGDVDFFKTVAPGILLNARDEIDTTVLSVAAIYGHLDCCEVIVERCPQLLYHQDSRLKWSVLNWVVVFNHDNNVENIMRFLITADSKPDLERGGGANLPNHSLLTMQDKLGWTALHVAVKYANHGATKLLLQADRGFELLPMADKQGQTCLHLAADKDDHESARPGIETEGTSKQTALHIAEEKKRLAIVQLLLEADHSNDLLAMVDNNQQTALRIAAKTGNLDMVKLIFKAGFDKQLLSMPDSRGNTPLHLAVENSNLEMVRLLIKGDMVAVYCGVNNDNQTPFIMAMDKAARDGSGSDAQVICKVLLENDWTKVVDFHGQNVLHVAAYHGHLAVVQHFLKSKDTDIVALLNTQDEDGNTPLHLAVSKDNVEVVRLLLEALQISAHIANISEQTTYMMAMGKILSDGHGECSNLDMELGEGVKMPNKRLLMMQNICGNTALHLVVTKRNHEITKLLLEADHDFELRRMVDGDGRTCLHIAVDDGNLDMVKLICKAGFDKQLLSMPDSQGNTTLHLAVRNNNSEIVRILIEGGMVIDYCASNSCQTPLLVAMDKVVARDESSLVSEVICKLLLEKDPSQCTKQTGDMGWTPLHYAISYGLNSIVKDIIRLCPDCIKVEDSHGDTPYMTAVRRILSDERREYLISDSKIIRMLLEKDPKQCTKLEDEHEQPFIHVAVKLGLIDVVKTILNSKEIEATILNLQDKDGNTPLHIAALGQDKCITLCLLYDARVSKVIENNKKEKAIDLIKFDYDMAKAGLYALGDPSDFKHQSNFDLVVAALIATVSFTAGFTVPGGYVSNGDNKGSAILVKATTFKVFVVSNNFALLFSLYTVFLHFSTRCLLKKDDIFYDSKKGIFRTRLPLQKDMIYQLNIATLCILSAIYCMVVAFITGSYAVLANSDELAITVCVSSCFFLILASHATWTLVRQYFAIKE